MHSLDGVQRNIELIGKLFPNAITEVKRNGKVEHAIDFDVLRQELSDSIVEGREERYQFTWPDKKKAMLAANAPITATLRPVVADSVGKDGTPGGFDSENLYIEGDNLEVLKLLQETYLGKVKMIYIDPPYNTGNDFVYEDDFAQSAAEYMDNSGQYDEEGNRMVTNTESNGRFHTDWLNMIYPRLKLAKDLLSDDGVILASIGDKELRNLQAVMDEIYGAANQVCCFVWKSRAKPTNAGSARFKPQKVAEYVLVYSKSDPEKQIYNVIPAKERTYPHEDELGKFRTTTILTSNRGTFRRETMRFESHGYTPSDDFRWKAGKETIDRLYDTNHMYVSEDGVPMEKKYAQEESDPLYPIYTFVDADLSGTAESGKAELGRLVGKQHGFDTVKPVQLIKYLVQTFTNKKDIILDFFSGSATTAQAVIEQNEEDHGTRKYILVQIEEKCDPDGEAFKAGFKTICEIGKERIRRAGKQILSAGGGQLEMSETQPEPGTPVDVGFRCLRLDSSNMENVYYTPEEISQQDMFSLVDNVKLDRTPEDLLFQVMLDLGVLLSSPIEVKEIAGKKVFNVADGFLLACFDHDVTEETVKAIAQMKPYYAVFRDSSMANDSVATNFDQIFETYSPETVRKVL
ncbi:MAG: hypothetical protein BHV88_21790 [Clostridiales bacterium 41_12_two_minus]|nr:MAG: hypothetical protein BHV88_21790 [Clostridiales bacterium 41_12_two_minus]